MRISILIFSVIIIVHGCKSKRLDVDVSEVKLSATFERLDSLLFETPTAKLPNVIEMRLKNDSAFMQQYFLGALNFGYYPMALPAKDSLFEFARDSSARVIYGMVKKQFGDLQSVKSELSEASKHLLFHFPSLKIPRFVFYTHGSSSFAPGNSFGTFAYPNAIGISLDAFLGKAYEWIYASNLKLNVYQIRYMAPAYVVPAAMRSLIEFHFPLPGEGNNFLAKAIEEGKRQYLLDATLPEVHDSIKLHFTSVQYDWMIKNEAPMWDYFIGKKLLFISDQRQMAEFFVDGPFTNADGVPQECPPRLGIYLGWRIVSSYMEKHPEISLAQLLKETRYEYVLKESGYKPK